MEKPLKKRLDSWTNMETYRPHNLNIKVKFAAESDFLTKTIHMCVQTKFVWKSVPYKYGYLLSCLRSNFNSRGVNTREIGRFLGHNSEPVRS